MSSKMIRIAGFCALAMAFAAPAAAKDAPAPSVSKCETAIGTIAITDGDQQGWTQFNLSSPRAMLGTMIEQSGLYLWS